MLLFFLLINLAVLTRNIDATKKEEVVTPSQMREAIENMMARYSRLTDEYIEHLSE